jgi:hypothetical protein
VLPRRLGVRFALEALFLVALAAAAGLAHLRPLYIVAIMAVAWLLVAAAELTASRIERSPVSYLLPEPTREEQEEEEGERIFHPRPEERTVVAPPIEQASAEEPEPEEEAEVVAAAVEAAPAAEDLVPDEPGEAEPPADEAPVEEPKPGKRRFRLRRRQQEAEPESPAPPRHVKLLPRRSTAEPSRASKEVAELFGSSGHDDGEETGT